MTGTLLDTINRLVAIEKEAIANSDAWAAQTIVQEGFPYFTHHYQGCSVETNSQDYYRYTHHIDIIFHLGKLTQGYLSLIEQSLWSDISVIIEYISSRIRLQSAAYPAIMTDIDPMGVIVTNVGPYQPVEWGGVGTQTVGITISIDVPIEVAITQAY